MTCPDCRRRLHERLDGVPASDVAGLDAHLAACPDCHALFAAVGRLEVGLRALTPPRPPADLGGRVVGRVLADRRRRARRRRALFAGLAVAAGLLLTLTLLARKSGTPDVVHGPTVTPPETAPTPSLRDNVAEATSAVASLTRRTAGETAEGSRLLLPDLPLPATDDAGLADALEPSAESLREAGHGVGAGLEPVTNSARRAVALFLRDLPVAAERKPGL